ncbi:MAG: 1,4-dihydroxy-2-naphthoate polyprenyltransferase [Actinomycetales bacterium]|nr:1,4-dihydroxy-2-naphthoate polyprenyltransferase [Actinomycetales bacterium]
MAKKTKSNGKKLASQKPKPAVKQTQPVSKARLWIAGARLRTLPLAIAPVAIGVGAAATVQAFSLTLSLLALAVALLLQIGVNFANDYSDGIRGTDDFRVGPMRLTGSKAVPAKQVKFAAFTAFALAGLAGLAIVLITQIWWFLVVGAVAIVAAWFYTGGKRPYGYAGLGEVVVFIFFGPVAAMGTAYIQIGSFDGNSLLGGIAAGSWAAAVLMVNNIRDIKQDALSGKRTLAVKLGERWSKVLYCLLVVIPFPILVPFLLLYPATWIAWLSVLFAFPLVLIVSTAKSVPELLLALKLTSFGALTYALFLAWGLYKVSAIF